MSEPYIIANISKTYLSVASQAIFDQLGIKINITAEIPGQISTYFDPHRTS